MQQLFCYLGLNQHLKKLEFLIVNVVFSMTLALTVVDCYRPSSATKKIILIFFQVEF